ncbi:Peptidase S54 rhomboid domain [Trinorchestia longiramus]|nr:Peptidase S54 rhomboid domain [Trinorchestia longiramus]
MKFTDVVAAAVEKEESVDLQTRLHDERAGDGSQAHNDPVEFPLASRSEGHHLPRTGSATGNLKADLGTGNSKYHFKNAVRTMQNNTMEFLGLTEDWEEKHDARWRQQRLRLAGRQGPDKTYNHVLVQQTLRRKAAQARMRVAARDVTDAVEMQHMQAQSLITGEDEDAADDRTEDEIAKDSVASITFFALSRVAGKWKRAAAKPSEEETVADLTDAPEQVVRVNLTVSRQPQPPTGLRAWLRGLQQQVRHGAVRAWLRGLQQQVRHGAVRAWLRGLQQQVRHGAVRAWLRGLQQQVKDNHDDSRPYFTWWVSTVQVIVLLLSMVLYTTAPVGVGLKVVKGEILTTSLSLEIIVYEEPGNLWFGPRQADLVALGAKYTPCMRRDVKIRAGIMKQQELEATTGCCIRHDLGGCVQTIDDQCSENLSHWDKWTDAEPGPDNRLSGPVCGQDPRVCTAPASVAPNVWPDDITEWPVCLSSNLSLGGVGPSFQSGVGPSSLFGGDTSITCEVVGRPCCVGIHGECHITTREHCNFLHGTFHEEAALCSQIECLRDVCKMLAFLDPEVPDQVYRLWVSIFIHPGVIPLLFTLFLHVTLLRNLEKFAGTLRVTIIYIVCGITGNLASAIFVPYRPEVGPSGSIAGTIGCLFIIFIVDVKEKLRSSWKIFLKWMCFLLICFIVGLFPGVDNYANIFGFIMGLLLAAALLPHVGRTAPPEKEYLQEQTTQHCTSHPHHRIIAVADLEVSVKEPVRRRSSRWYRALVVIITLSLAVALLVVLFVVLYLVPFECDWCIYLDCIPFTDTLCADMQTSFERHKIIT